MFKNNLLLLKKVFKYNKLLLIFRIFVAALNSVSVLLTILMPMYLLNSLLDGDFLQALRIVVIFGVLYLVISYIGTAFSAYDKIASEKMYLRIVNEFLQKSIDLDLSYFDNTHSFDKYNRAFGNCCRSIDSINAIMSSFVTSIFNIIFIVGLLAWMDLYMFTIILAAIAINLLVNNKLKKIDYEHSVLLSEKNKQVNYLYRLFYIPQLVRETKVNNLSEYIFKLKSGFDSKLMELNKRQVKKRTPFSVLLSTLSIIESSIVALYFGFSVVVQRIAISEYFTYVNAYNQLKNTILSLTSIHTQLYGNSLFASDYLDFLSSKECLTLNNEGVLLDEVNSIEFVGVSFKYPNSHHFALNKVSFSISKGDKIAIIGKNGAGKTTIIKLLLRLYNPTEGSIFINGMKLEEYNTKSLRNAIQVLFQDFALYAFSIMDNLSLGKDICQKNVWDALEKVGLSDKVKNLKYSIDTPISSQLYADGIELSGGEAQKLAISRIYASNPGTFVMDEPTSSLDPQSEYLLYERLMEDSGRESIVIVISHRLTLTYRMSKIIVIENGSVIEQGTHKELVNLKGVYNEMYSIQASKYTSS